MIFVFPITLPPNTTASAPVITPLQLTAGTITDVEIQYPSGVVALAHLQLYWGLHQMWPSNPESDFATSNETIDWDEETVVDQPPFALTAKGWNTDTTFPHTLTVRVIMHPSGSGSNLAAQVASLLGSAGGTT